MILCVPMTRAITNGSSGQTLLSNSWLRQRLVQRSRTEQKSPLFVTAAGPMSTRGRKTRLPLKKMRYWSQPDTRSKWMTHIMRTLWKDGWPASPTNTAMKSCFPGQNVPAATPERWQIIPRWTSTMERPTGPATTWSPSILPARSQASPILQTIRSIIPTTRSVIWSKSRTRPE